MKHLIALIILLSFPHCLHAQEELPTISISSQADDIVTIKDGDRIIEKVSEIGQDKMICIAYRYSHPESYDNLENALHPEFEAYLRNDRDWSSRCGGNLSNFIQFWNRRFKDSRVQFRVTQEAYKSLIHSWCTFSYKDGIISIMKNKNPEYMFKKDGNVWKLLWAKP